MDLQVDCCGQSVCFAAADTELSAYVSTLVLRGETYPPVDQVPAAHTIVDVGANIGAAAVYFANCHPTAEVFALEPAAVPFGLLEANTEPYGSVRTERIGLFSRDMKAKLNQGAEDSATASIGEGAATTTNSEEIQLRRASTWFSENGLLHVDILKLDTEGCEVPILTDLLQAGVAFSLLYIEYHSESDRREIDGLLASSHVLVRGSIPYVHRGELTYAARHAFSSDSELAKRQITVNL